MTFFSSLKGSPQAASTAHARGMCDEFRPAKKHVGLQGLDARRRHLYCPLVEQDFGTSLKGQIAKD